MQTAVLQREITVIILGKIGRFLFAGDSSGRIVQKFSAPLIRVNNSFFRAQDGVISQFCAICAVTAGALKFLSKQHT